MKAASSFVCLLIIATTTLFAQTPEIQKQVSIDLELKRLEGTWVPQSINRDGKGEERGGKLKSDSFVFKGKTFQRQKNGRTIMEGRLEVDPTKTPKALDMVVTAKKRSAAVYDLAGDTLTVCFDTSGQGRPAELKAGKNRSLVVYQRRQP
jgi:uncharacterized protein (TIGR03067 family)